jgi:dTDP-4-dehydrorhamnose reductase
MNAPPKRKLLVTGASGLLGLNLGVQMGRRFDITGVANSHLLASAPFPILQNDLAQPGRFARLLEQVRPDAVIHAAALASLDLCEKDPALSRRLNAELPGEVAQACLRRSIPLAHISTDSVFDGLRGSYVESDAPNPQGVYASDKWRGEQAVASAYPAAFIARVNFFGWSISGRRSLAEFFVANLAAGKAVNGFTDVIFCPLIVDALAETLVEMLEKGLDGTYHVLSRECLSKYQFGRNIARRFGFDDSLINPISVADSGLTARRSPNLNLGVEKLETALGRAMPGQAEMLERFYRQYLEGYPQMIQSLCP